MKSARQRGEIIRGRFFACGVAPACAGRAANGQQSCTCPTWTREEIERVESSGREVSLWHPRQIEKALADEAERAK